MVSVVISFCHFLVFREVPFDITSRSGGAAGSKSRADSGLHLGWSFEESAQAEPEGGGQDQRENPEGRKGKLGGGVWEEGPAASVLSGAPPSQ